MFSTHLKLFFNPRDCQTGGLVPITAKLKYPNTINIDANFANYVIWRQIKA